MTNRAQADLYPIKLRPRAVEKVWGGRSLERVLGRRLPGRSKIGEIWVAWDGLTIVNGRWRGQVLRGLVTREGPSILGDRMVSAEVNDFPLLVKFLDAEQNLSIQVHPNDDYARAIEAQPFGKSEMWYVVEAQPGAVLFQGLSHAMKPLELRSALESGTIVDHLSAIEVKAGDVFVNAPGTIHALGGGILIYELQQSSDLTYRLYDWDRASTGARRPLHIDKAVDVVDYSPLAVHQVQAVRLKDADRDRRFLGASRYYAAELWTINGTEVVAALGDRFELITTLQGGAQVQIDGATPAVATIAAGDTALIPAGVETYRLVSIGQPARLIRSYVPDLRRDLVDPLRAVGVSDDEIVQLGGDPRTSDLSAAVRDRKLG